MDSVKGSLASVCVRECVRAHACVCFPPTQAHTDIRLPEFHLNLCASLPSLPHSVLFISPHSCLLYCQNLLRELCIVSVRWIPTLGLFELNSFFNANTRSLCHPSLLFTSVLLNDASH